MTEQEKDMELLELAARAAGYEYDPTAPFEIKTDDEWREWSPLADDGDALRLAVKLTLEVDICLSGIAVRTPDGHKVLVDADEVKCAYAATRRAIVRAAAAIGSERHE